MDQSVRAVAVVPSTTGGRARGVPVQARALTLALLRRGRRLAPRGWGEPALMARINRPSGLPASGSSPASRRNARLFRQRGAVSVSQRRPSHLRCIFDLGKQIRFHTGTSTCFVLDLRLFQLLVDHRRRNAPIQKRPRLGGTRRYRRRVQRLREREGRLHGTVAGEDGERPGEARDNAADGNLRRAVVHLARRSVHEENPCVVPAFQRARGSRQFGDESGALPTDRGSVPPR